MVGIRVEEIDRAIGLSESLVRDPDRAAEPGPDAVPEPSGVHHESLLQIAIEHPEIHPGDRVEEGPDRAGEAFVTDRQDDGVLSELRTRSARVADPDRKVSPPRRIDPEVAAGGCAE
jgi:hypothetical protein